MEKVVISDTSCLIALDKINRLKILKDTFPVLLTTKEVQREFGKDFPSWIIIEKVKDDFRKKELEAVVDAGEASAIALAVETKNCILIIDEKKGRRIARQLEIEIIGTLKVLLLAKEKKAIPSVSEVLNELNSNGFRFSPAIRNEILKEAKEV